MIALLLPLWGQWHLGCVFLGKIVVIMPVGNFYLFFSGIIGVFQYYESLSHDIAYFQRIKVWLIKKKMRGIRWWNLWRLWWGACLISLGSFGLVLRYIFLRQVQRFYGREAGGSYGCWRRHYLWGMRTIKWGKRYLWGMGWT